MRFIAPRTQNIRSRRRRGPAALATALAAALLLTGVGPSVAQGPARAAAQQDVASAVGTMPLTVDAAAVQPAQAAPAALLNRTASSLTVLVNKSYPLSPMSYVPANLRTVDAYSMRPEIATAWTQLKRDAAARGYSLRLVSAYRSYAYQRDLYNRYVQQYGQTYADRVSAKPGHSEHQTGLAIDIGLASGSCQLTSCFGDTAAGKWVAANAWRYGLILRYPQGTESVTGYMYEPWHFRYVGHNLAAEMKTRNLPLLEQYYNGRNPSVTTDASLVFSTASSTATRAATYRGGYGGAKYIGVKVPADAVDTFTADWNNDGTQDLLVQRSSGQLVAHYGRHAGGFQAGVVVASGLAGRQLAIGPWWLGRDRLISVTSTGQVYRHWHTTGAVTSSAVVGTVPAPRAIFLADLDGNGSTDLATIDRSGVMRAHPSSSSRGLTGTSRMLVTRWGEPTGVHVVRGFDGPGTQTLMARRPSTGVLYARTLSSTGAVGSPRTVLTGVPTAWIFK